MKILFYQIKEYKATQFEQKSHSFYFESMAFYYFKYLNAIKI